MKITCFCASETCELPHIPLDIYSTVSTVSMKQQDRHIIYIRCICDQSEGICQLIRDLGYRFSSIKRVVDNQQEWLIDLGFTQSLIKIITQGKQSEHLNCSNTLYVIDEIRERYEQVKKRNIAFIKQDKNERVYYIPKDTDVSIFEEQDIYPAMAWDYGTFDGCVMTPEIFVTLTYSIDFVDTIFTFTSCRNYGSGVEVKISPSVTDVSTETKTVKQGYTSAIENIVRCPPLTDFKYIIQLMKLNVKSRYEVTIGNGLFDKAICTNDLPDSEEDMSYGLFD